jgi:predicted DNA-binding transcriptional regulator AlpA
MTELITVVAVANLLHLSKSQVYELTNPRTRSGDVRTNPLPALRLGTAVRFREHDVEAWLDSLAQVQP